jgi:hypothetical protein
MTVEVRTDYWICEISFFDSDYVENCPRCGKPCPWVCSITIWPSGPIRKGTMHWPMCHCPDDQIRAEIAHLLAEALVKDLRDRPAR